MKRTLKIAGIIILVAALLRILGATEANRDSDTRFAAPPPEPGARPARSNPDKLKHLPGQAPG